MTPGRDIKLLLSDVDGTLVDRDKQLTPATLAAARALREAGVALAVTSARPPRGLRMLIEPLDLQTPLSGFNGGLIVDTNFQGLVSHILPPDAAFAAVDLMIRGGLDVWVYTEKAWYVRNPAAPRVARETGIIQMEPVIVPAFGPELLSGAFKIVGVSDDLPRIMAIEATLRETLGVAVSATRSTPYFLDVTHPSATKGSVVHYLAGRLGLHAAQIATIGDMFNDVSMFCECGLSIAMGNAAEAVKMRANLATDSNEQDGFAKAVERFLLAPRA